MDLGNYKIKVTTEAESREAQELFFALGYDWHLREKQYISIGNNKFITAYPDEMILRMGSGGDTKKETTLAQLRDLVVLHRNDVSDATHIKNDGEMFGYLSSDNVEYTWNFVKNNWFKSSIYFSDSGIKPINQGLISGADALRALADGKTIEYFYIEWVEITQEFDLGVFNRFDKFRIKPRTITLNIEIPAPFEPKVGEKYFYLAHMNIGYDHDIYESTNTDECQTQLGAWRTKEEIKQVVSALRGALKNG